MVNKVILLGALGKDPESRQLNGGGTVTNCSLATSKSWKDKQTGAKQEKTEWHRLVFFNRRAEVAAQYLRKGSKIYIEGELQTRKWTDNAGVDHYTTEILVNDMQMISTGQGQQNGGYQQQQNNGYQQNNQGQQNNGYQQQNNGYQQNQPQRQGQNAGQFEDFDDEPPF